MKINSKISGQKIAHDSGLGYPVWRAWRPEEAVEYIAVKERPDLIVAMTGKIVPVVLAAKNTRIPIAVQLNDVAFAAHGGNFADLGRLPCIANSRFTAEKFRRAFGVAATVIHPFISVADYRTKTTRENITFINPVAHKGRGIALDIARLCPDIPLTFVEALPLDTAEDRTFLKLLPEFPNVALLPPQKNMRKIYAKCKIVLAPSLCEEAYGRIVTEAQASGIPAIASLRGGLPEAVGPGGILVDPDGPIDDWVKAVRRLWHDDMTYARLSAEATAHAERQEMNFDYQVEAHEKALLAAAVGA